MLWHHWDEDYKIKIKYETMIFASFYKKEQRRALRTIPLLEISIGVTALQHIDSQAFLGLEWENLYIPIEPEIFTGTRGAPGSKTVTTTSDISYHYFLKNITGLYLVDEAGNVASIVSVVGTTITLSQDIAGTSSNFYPAIKAITKNINSTFITSRILSCPLIFEQVKE